MKKRSEQATTQPAEDDVLIAYQEAGRMLGGVGKRRLRRLVDAGAFHTYTEGSRTVYSKREVLAYVASVKAAGPSRAAWRGNVAADEAGARGNASRAEKKRESA